MSPKNVVSSSVSFVTTIVYISILLNLASAVKPKGFSMKMIRSDSKESPLYPRYANVSERERFQRLVGQSKARARYFRSARAAAYNKSSSMNPDIIRIPIKYKESGYYYIGKVGIGNFNNQPHYYYLIMDTGSDLTWTQCHGGNNYFYQDPPVFDQGRSSTYGRVPCEHFPDECDLRHCDNELCTYDEGYVSGQKTSGHLAYETFTFNSNTGGSVNVTNVIMGCGINQTNFGKFFGVPEKHEGRDFPRPLPRPGTAPIAGILGLGQDTSNLSLVLQLHVGKFEYCLDSYDGIASSYTYLRFGSDTIIGGGPEVHKTPIIQDPNFKTPYHLILQDISVGDLRLRFQPSDFQIREDGNGGTIIDSGAPFTTMSMRHFLRVKEAMLNYFADFRIQPIARRPSMLLDPCFHIPSGFNEYPEMTFHFQGGADFVIKQRSGIFTYYEDKNLLCFGIVGLNNHQFDVILGAMQQANKRILYDLNQMKLSFTEEDCNFGS